MSTAIGMPTIAELERAHPGEWLAIDVQRQDEDGNPLEGELLYHGFSREAAYDRIGTVPRSVCVLHNVPLRPSMLFGFF